MAVCVLESMGVILCEAFCIRSVCWEWSNLGGTVSLPSRAFFFFFTLVAWSWISAFWGVHGRSSSLICGGINHFSVWCAGHCLIQNVMGLRGRFCFILGLGCISGAIDVLAIVLVCGRLMMINECADC